MIDQRVFFHAECVAENFVGAQGFVEDGVEERRVIGGPFERVGRVRNLVRQQLAGVEILHADGVLFVAFEIHRIRQQAVVGAGDEGAEAEIFVAFGEQVAIEQDFFGPRTFFAALDGVLLPFFGARVVEVFVALHGHAQVGLLDAAEHLGVERGLQGFGVLQLFLGVRFSASRYAMVSGSLRSRSQK